MDPMYVLTVKRDGGTQDVVGFYEEWDLDEAIAKAERFLSSPTSLRSKRAIVRLEYYNPHGGPIESPLDDSEMEPLPKDI